MEIKCENCGSTEFIVGTKYSSGVSLRCAHCTTSGKPTYIKNVNKAMFDSLLSAGKILAEFRSTEKSVGQVLPPMDDQLIPPPEYEQQLIPPDFEQAIDSLDTPTNGGTFEEPKCLGCQGDQSVKVIGSQYAMRINNGYLIYFDELTGQIILQQKVNHCPICGRRL